MERVEICQAKNCFVKENVLFCFYGIARFFLCYYVMPPNDSEDWHLSGNNLFLAVSIFLRNFSTSTFSANASAEIGADAQQMVDNFL